LHDLNDARADALLLQENQIIGLQRSDHAMSTDMIDDQLFGNTGASHRDDVIDRNRPGDNRSAYSGFNLGAVLGFDFIEAAADNRSGDSAHACADSCARGRAADSVANDRTYAGASEAAEQGTLVGVIGRLTSRAGGHAEKCGNSDGQKPR
jgi:hypothetical protein